MATPQEGNVSEASVATSSGLVDSPVPKPFDGTSEFFLPTRMRELINRLNCELIIPCRNAIDNCQAKQQETLDNIEGKFRARRNILDDEWGKSYACFTVRLADMERSHIQAIDAYQAINSVVEQLLTEARVQYARAASLCRGMHLSIPQFEETYSCTSISAHIDVPPDDHERPFTVAKNMKAEMQRAVQELVSIEPPRFLPRSTTQQVSSVYACDALIALLAYGVACCVSGMMLQGAWIAVAIVFGFHLSFFLITTLARRRKASSIVARLRSANKSMCYFGQAWRSLGRERLTQVRLDLDRSRDLLNQEKDIATTARHQLLEIEERDHNAALDAAAESHKQAMVDVQLQYALTASTLRDDIKAFWSLCNTAGCAWDHESWQTWQPDESPEFAARLGRFIVEAEDLEKRLPEVGFRFEFPALVPFTDGKCLMICGASHYNDDDAAKSQPETAKQYRKTAEQGDAEAQHSLARRYDNGDGVAKDESEAAKWYRRAAEQGHAEAQFCLAWDYANGKGVTKDQSEAVKWYHKAAEQGHAKAQYNLALSYFKGIGVSLDQAEAFKWFRKAAEQGDVDAQYSLAFRYDNGEGVSKDLSEAAKWYRKAAEQGHAGAQFCLAWDYANGEGVIKDLSEAVKWYRKAAEQGHVKSQIQMGISYSKGKGVLQDQAEAVKWFRKVAEQGNADVQYILAQHYSNGTGVARDQSEAVKWYRKAAEQGDAGAQFRLACCYDDGDGVAEDKSDAVKWYRKAAEQGHAQAQFRLGSCYENGEGVGKDESEALKWYRRFAEQKDPDDE